MRVVATSRREGGDLPADVPERWRRLARRLSDAERAALGATWELVGAATELDVALLVIAPETVPSAALIAGTEAAVRAWAIGEGAAFRSDPTFLVDMMDNTLLAAITIALGFTGDAVNLGTGPAQQVAAVELAEERLSAGAREVVLVGAAGSRGVAARLAAGDDGGALAVALAWLGGEA